MIFAGSRSGTRLFRTDGTAINLDRAARDAAAAWLPPGFAYDEPAVEEEDAQPDEESAAEAEEAQIDAGNLPQTGTGDPEPAEFGEDAESEDIPAFLTGDLPHDVRPNGAAGRVR